MKLFQLIALLLIILMMTSCKQKTEAPIAPQNSPYFMAQDKLLEVEDVQVRYRDQGPRDATPIIMVHGFTSSLETWDALTTKLKGEYRIIRLDLPGHGLTGPDPQERYSNEETVKFLSSFIDAIDVEHPVLIGNSLGGLTSWRLAAAFPDRLSGIVLISPGGFSINGVAETPVDVPMMVKVYLSKAPKAGVKQATAALYADPEKLTDTRVKAVRDMMLWPGNGDAFIARAASFTLPDPTETLKGIETPTLIIWGDKDIMVPVAHSNKFTSALPNAKLKIYENIGHVPQEEAPGKLADDIKEFLTAMGTP